MDHMGPFSFNAVRFLLGAASLLPLIWFFSRKKAVATTPAAKTSIWLAGGVAGAILFVAAALQQVGLLDTTAAKAGFITGLYMILVPFLGLFLRHVTGLNAWLGAVLALVGLYLLSINADFSMSRGDFLMFIGAIFWACHILWIDFIGRRVNALQLSAVQFLACGLLSSVAAFWQEAPTFASILLAWPAILFASFISVGLAYTLQVVAQKRAKPTHAAIIMSMEAVFAAIGGVVFLDENLPMRGWIGCGLMMIGMLLSQIPLPKFNRATT
jgi:drug/metabolite transporter (DMT)-like permease